MRGWTQWRPQRGPVVFAQAVAAVVAGGLASATVTGYVVAGVGGAVGIASLVRVRGAGLADLARSRLRDPAQPGTGAPTDQYGVGAALRLLPALHVVDAPVRGRTRGIGVVGDGRGFAAALEAALPAGQPWALSGVVSAVLDDPARPAAVQVLIEQRSGRRAAGDPTFAPGRSYRDLPTHGIPLWHRAVLVIRHEPTWAPETVDVRGGGAAGARRALTSVTTRIAAHRSGGPAVAPLDASGLSALFRDLGDPGPDSETRERTWTTSTACHTSVSVAVTTDERVAALLEATSELDVDRVVLSVAVSAVDHTVCGVLRLVAPDPDHLEAAVEALVLRELVTALPGNQEAGFVATLPLGGGARSFAALVDQVRT